MSENIPPPPAPSSSNTGAPADVPGQPYYDKARAHLKDLLKQKANIDRSLAAMEETIFKKETEYLEDTPSGNIITGFDAYTKLAGMMMSGGGAGGSVGGYGAGGRGERRRGVVKDELRVFSRSSVTWNVNAESPLETAVSTPNPSTAPTPVNTSFMRLDGPSNNATPTSATSGNKNGQGVAAGALGVGKKNKKVGGGGEEESEAEGRESKKARVNFGGGRK